MKPFPSAVRVSWLAWLQLASVVVCGAGASAPRFSVCLNGVWEVAPGDDRVEIPADGWTAARIPAPPIADGRIRAQWHRLSFDAPKDWAAPDAEYYLELEKSGHYAAVFCNGQKLGEHYGQFTPITVSLGSSFQPGARNQLSIYVHNASGRFVRPGADIQDPMVGNAYRAAAESLEERNWIGVVGDITLIARPTAQIADVFVETSVRQKTITAHIAAQHPASLSGKLSFRGAVLDGTNTLLELAPQPAAADSAVTRLTASWTNPILWGSPPYGDPKLYTLRVELLQDGQLVDRAFSRFGFREVWVEGRDVLLNGQKLWLAGTYYPKLSALRYLNDARVIAAALRLMQASGLNTLHSHWDDPGRPWLEACDESGMFMIAAFFCDGRPKIHSSADEGWLPWMNGVCAEWARARRNHPSLILWRPTDVLPPDISRFADNRSVIEQLARTVRDNDPSRRPLADGSDLFAWGQPATGKDANKYDNWDTIANHAHAHAQPILCKEIYTGFADTGAMSQFFSNFYAKSFEYKSTGLIVQHLPLLSWSERPPFAFTWPSASGAGNRNRTERGGGELANWCDPAKPAWRQSEYGRLFDGLFSQFMKARPQAPFVLSRPELLASGLAPGTMARLEPRDPTLAEPLGVLSAPDGTAWFVVPIPGEWRLIHAKGEQAVIVLPRAATREPGYDYTQRIQVGQ